MVKRYLHAKGIQETISDADTPASSSGSILGLLGGLANRLRAITGKGSWTQTPDANLADAASHHAARNNPHVVTRAQLGAAAQTALDSHTANQQNPHGVTLSQVGGAPASHATATDNPHSVTAAQAGAPPTSRTISTTAPLSGGGSLAANRTLSITEATTSAAGSMSAADKTKLNGLNASDYAPSSHVGSRDGHPLATATQNGLYPAADKAKLDTLAAPQRVYTPPAWTTQTIEATGVGWLSTMLVPEMSVPALGAPPIGFRWLLDIEGGIRIRPPASNVSIFFQIQFDRAAVGSSVEGGGTLFASSQGALSVFRYGAPPPATNRSFTVNFYMWVNATGTYEILSSPFPACRAYLVAA